MKKISILNDVLGPVMRGPSSSHTAGSFHIGRLAADLLGKKPKSAVFCFDSRGSYARTYREQSADRGFLCGLMGVPLIDDRFYRIFDVSARQKCRVEFRLQTLKGEDHPNAVRLDMKDEVGRVHRIHAESTGGGSCRLTRWNGWPVALDGKDYGCLVWLPSPDGEKDLRRWMKRMGAHAVESRRQGNRLLNIFRFCQPLPEALKEELERLYPGVEIRTWSALFPVPRGEGPWRNLKEFLESRGRERTTLGEAGIRHEAALLKYTPKDCMRLMEDRLRVMRDSIKRGMKEGNSRMKLMDPVAEHLFRALTEKHFFAGGLQTKAAVRSLAVMHACNSGEVVCAAPTGGSAGVLPGVLETLPEFSGRGGDTVGALFAAGMVGCAVASRATFAAETAGCQVEIGAAGAMAAAAVVEYAGGSAAQALDAAAIALQNTMGSPCDLVQGLCEIPCHTRNAAAAHQAFLCADLAMGGYRNPIPLWETIDASYRVGKTLPPELRCTSRGGLAIAPSARKLSRRDCKESFTRGGAGK